jgi:hypothetical protein
VAPQTTPSPELPTYIFSPRELQRLAAYRAAVVARFYNDEADTADTPRLPSKPASMHQPLAALS